MRNFGRCFKMACARNRWPDSGGLGHLRHREIDSERGSESLGRLHRDGSFEVEHDAVDCGETEATAVADALRGVEGFEHMLQDRTGYSPAIVRYAQTDARPIRGDRPDMHEVSPAIHGRHELERRAPGRRDIRGTEPAGRFVERRLPNRDLDRARPRADGVARVHTQIHYDLGDLAWIGVDRGGGAAGQ